MNTSPVKDEIGERDQPRMVERRRVLRGALLGAVAAAILISIGSRGHISDATSADGELYRFVAQHLASSRDEVAPTLAVRGTSIRYGRIGLPAALWLFSLGRHRAMIYVQPILMILSAAVAAGLFAFFIRGPPVFALCVFLSVGFVMAIVSGAAEGSAVALALLAIGFAERRHLFLATVSMSAAILTKESALVVLGGMLFWYLIRRNWRGLWLAASVSPFLAWGIFVARRFGHFPLQDPWLTQKTLGTPGVALWKTLVGGGGPALVAGLHLLLALGALRLVWLNRSKFSLVALLGSLQIFVTAPVVWHFEADGFRSAVFQEVFLIIALVTALRHRSSVGEQIESSVV